jgi:hypothetical protein
VVRSGRVECAVLGQDAIDSRCRFLGGLEPRDLEPLPRRTACAHVYGGPAAARVTGDLRSVRVSADFDLTDGCEIGRLRRNAALLGAPGGRARRSVDSSTGSDPSRRWMRGTPALDDQERRLGELHFDERGCRAVRYPVAADTSLSSPRRVSRRGDRDARVRRWGAATRHETGPRGCSFSWVGLARPLARHEHP